MSKRRKKINRTNIGGQAVFEGVMMRGATSMATAVRDEDGVIRLETKRHSAGKKNIVFRIPVLRGAINFFLTMAMGVKTLMRSTEVFGGDEPSKFDAWLAKKLHIDVMNLVVWLGVILGLALSVFLFVFSPQWVAELITRFTTIKTSSVAFNFIEGGVRVLIFVFYILLTSLSKEIKRTYRYHGAEHKTISCYETGLPLTVENVRSSSRVHDRCGTTFMFFVMLVSILVFSVANSFLGVTGFLRLLVKLALLPLVAGISYELLKGLAKTDFFLFYPIKLPGLLLQRITTAEPDDGMIECAITAFETVLKMESDPTIEPVDFITAMKITDLRADVLKRLEAAGITDASDADWIVSLTAGVKRSEIEGNLSYASPSVVERAEKIADERASGRPLWYVVGDAEFYGRKFKVDERVLIPRPETEELVYNAIKRIKPEMKVLDLCTGSGVIAVTVKLETGCTVDAADVSAEALEAARENAELNNADINFIESDLFAAVGGKYDVIISNPPYVRSGEIDGLSKEISFEPRLALDGGEDGLDFYRRIARQAPEHLEKGGLLFLECGDGQAAEISKLFDGARVETIKDVNGVERIVVAEYSA